MGEQVAKKPTEPPVPVGGPQELFVDGVSSVVAVDGLAYITLTVRRFRPKKGTTTETQVANVTAGRLVMTLAAAVKLDDIIHPMIMEMERDGTITRRDDGKIKTVH